MSEMNLKQYDIAVIGSGPGGFSAAVRAAQLGAKVCLIEKDLTGGTCLNSGCIPTKFLWQALKTKQKIQKSYDYGFKATLEPFSFADIIDKKDKSISNIRKGMEMILSSYGVETIKGKASFKSPHCLLVENGADNIEVNAGKIIIASGAAPSEIRGLEFDGEKIVNSTDILNLREIPKKILIVGGGAIGIEIASILAGFGSSVTLAEKESQLLPGEDIEISEEVKKNLQRQSIEVLTSCNDAFDLEEDFDKTLVVTGRKPVNDLSLENAGLTLTEKGFIKTDEYCVTNVENIYAAGDISGKYMLAYTAQNEGSISAENAILGNKIKVDNSVVPAAVFSNPPAASVKVKNFSCNDEGISFGKFPFTASGRAFIENERTGFVKCAVEKNSGKPLAFWIVGAHADEMINTAAVILKSGTISRESMFHPSLSEGLFNAYEDALGKCTEIMKRK